jgi:hypothetical protein
VPPPEAPILGPSTGIPFDATDFTMNLSSTTGVLVSPCQITMEDWDTEEEDKEEVEVEIDPDLEDDLEESADEDDFDDEGGGDDDDAFEQYLFGEDEE